ncbi:MAG: GGDEF domain-containing response regulator [Vicinamibacterales bacterium]
MRADVIHVLLVEDNPGDARLVVEMLREPDSNDFVLTHVTTVAEAVAQLSKAAADVDVVLLDMNLPDESGLATVERVAAHAGRSSIVVMTGASDEERGLAAVQQGAQDYLVKGQVDGRSLRRALRFAIERHSVRIELENLTLKDDLTGLNNRRGFLILGEQMVKVARRQRSGFLLLFLDLDGLKTINDTFGHSEGNRALVEAADVLRSCFRQSDLVARLGGDEFAAITLDPSETSDAAVRHRLNEALRAVNDKPDRAYRLGFSVGIQSCVPDGTPLEALLHQADALMYEQKKHRRERGIENVP